MSFTGIGIIVIGKANAHVVVDVMLGEYAFPISPFDIRILLKKSVLSRILRTPLKSSRHRNHHSRGVKTSDLYHAIVIFSIEVSPPKLPEPRHPFRPVAGTAGGRVGENFYYSVWRAKEDKRFPKLAAGNSNDTAYVDTADRKDGGDWISRHEVLLLGEGSPKTPLVYYQLSSCQVGG